MNGRGGGGLGGGDGLGGGGGGLGGDGGGAGFLPAGVGEGGSGLGGSGDGGSEAGGAGGAGTPAGGAGGGAGEGGSWGRRYTLLCRNPPHASWVFPVQGVPHSEAGLGDWVARVTLSPPQHFPPSCVPKYERPAALASPAQLRRWEGRGRCRGWSEAPGPQ